MLENERLFARIVGTGSYVPPNVLTNADLSKMVNTSDEWITERTGIKTRHIAGADEATSDLAAEAGRRALETAGVAPEEVDCIVVGTCSPDMFFPSTGCLVQEKLGARNASAFDVSAACSGMIYSTSIGNAFIRSGQYETVLVIGADCITKMVDFEDRNTCVLFGDGAGAFLLQAAAEPGIEFAELGADGSQGKILEVPAGGSRIPASHESVDKRLHYVKAMGREVFKLECTACHTEAGHLGIRPLVQGKSVTAIEAILASLAQPVTADGEPTGWADRELRLTTWLGRRMPPFAGTEREKRALAIHLARLGGDAEAGLIETVAASEGSRVFEESCAACHGPDSPWPMAARLRGRSAPELYELIGRLPEIQEEMPPFMGTDDERRALAEHLAGLGASEEVTP